VESDHKVSFHELPVQLDQFLVGSFIPVLGWTPQLPELLPDAVRMIEGEVLVYGTPRAVQSAGNPAIDNDWIRSMPRIDGESTYA
jgi:hypothetical protein